MKRLAIALAVCALPSLVAAQPRPRGDDDKDPAADEAAQPEASPEAEDTAEDTAPSATGGDGGDLEALRVEYLRLRDKLFRSRARAAAVGDALYSTRLTVRLHWGSGRFYAVNRATIRLDGSNVFDDTQGTIAADDAPRFEGFVAPGRHVISVRVETEGKDDDRFASTIESSFTVLAPAGKAVVVDVTAKDDGDIPYAWKKKERGSYKLRLDAKVTTSKRDNAPAKKNLKRAQR
jgi:hypothetical protein